VTTARRNTALYRLHTPSQRVQEVTTALGEGVALAAGARIFGHDPRTLYRWLERSAQHAERVHNHFFKNLVCAHLQLDELVGKVRGQAERVFIWVAIEGQTKIVPVIYVGRRTNDSAQRFVHEIWQRLAKTCIPSFTTDGLRAYYSALTTHLGSWVVEDGQRKPQWQVSPQLRYGQLHKIKVGRRLRDMYTVVLCGTRTQLSEALNALHLSGQITTAYIERFNLTLRERIAPLARRTLALAQDEYLLGLHLAWFRAYYHFVLYHESLRIPGQSPCRYRYRTPAMAAGLARRRWRVRDLLLMPIPPA
jgi:IS1 family transposase